MLNPRSFAEIFDDLTKEETTSAADYSAGWESHLDPAAMAQLLGDLYIETSAKTTVRRAYPVKTKPTPVIERPAHTMNPEQTAAYGVLKSNAGLLKDNFTAQELKSAYRAAVLKTHPDTGGSSESFQDVKKSYQILAALVKN